MARITLMHPPISLVLVDDDPSTLDLWSRQLNCAAGFVITGTFADAESALPWLLAHPPKLLLTDLQLPGEDGLWLVREVKRPHPAMRAVLITNHDLEELPVAALRAGLNGCLLKPDSPTALPARLRAVVDGTCVYSARVMQRLSEQFHAGPPASAETLRRLALLTEREREVLRAFARGLPGKLVADQLQISETTVKTHKEHIVAKLGVQSFMEAVARFAPHLD
ncbi:MAG: LuxR family transcriptional regulator [Limisphaerales bacterium]|nr:MAG: LuxR family transcriptional regulator [Limisphaerales bacterium]KAG0509499.1 MAG: LuxR family transcriptional regulator [Limisphaerales bacterium]TXT52335.1 MAG: LuxR family transcriptional regulator [Limisphaerales bacterium]